MNCSHENLTVFDRVREISQTETRRGIHDKIALDARCEDCGDTVNVYYDFDRVF